MFDMTKQLPDDAGRVMDAALAYAWSVLISTPHDGGITSIEFSHDPESLRRWSGERRQRTEEGHANVLAEVYEPTVDDPSWVVDVSYDSRDCDGRYTSVSRAYFLPGEAPRYVGGHTRDHSAEAAGY